MCEENKEGKKKSSLIAKFFKKIADKIDNKLKEPPKSGGCCCGDGEDKIC
ncbi:MAG: hypothetical protein P9X22_01465 [Candidatus Zapsychrus exili]|nr:hypothetical protein [Candidatus Zapsychrus exili]